MEFISRTIPDEVKMKLSFTKWTWPNSLAIDIRYIKGSVQILKYECKKLETVSHAYLSFILCIEYLHNWSNNQARP